ncbi:MAG: threonine-phosphate decarboxylase CobD [Alphaproteobacteria bacterium]|uniref:threonine-phosphate decarboxylase n=1 Tax=Candidatus Nitrobium versatile TaxID=2884831 RepID=A0A953SDM9_9BACT|nr:threonine-phosphate decarboxylase CobD [Candidatus Nitrobium versatile]
MTQQNSFSRKHTGTHGGNIYRVAEQLGIEESEIIDFSASINPLGVPKSVMSDMRDAMKQLCHYPDPDTKQLRLWLAKHMDLNPHSLLCGNGSTELIYLIVRALRPERVLIPAPSFSEYERAVNDPSKVSWHILWEKNGFAVNPDRFIADMAGKTDATSYKSALATSVDMAFLCNPNNPTGKLLSREDMLKIAEAAKKLKCFLVVDEAFIDFVPEYSIIKEVENNPYLIVLRSLTKFYALSGIRIGFAVLPSSIIDVVRGYKEPWTVNTLAQVAGIAALNDTAYQEETFRVVRNEKKVLEDGFKLLGIQYFPSAVNYYLLKRDNAQEIAAALLKKGIMVRDCSSFMGLDGTYLRVAVKSNRENMRLLKELAPVCMA